MSGLVSFCLKNRFLVLIGAVLAIAIGSYSALMLPIDAVPDITPNQVIVYTTSPSLSPLELEQLVTFPVETAMSGLPGVKDAITRLHGLGYRMGVATNDSTRGAERTLAALGMSQLFDAAYGYDAVANPKPAPDTVRAFCDLTGCKASEVAMVGDNRHDMEMARAAGVGMAIGVLSGNGTRETLSPLADILIGSVADLPGLLSGR